jgi:beta-lactamase class A
MRLGRLSVRNLATLMIMISDNVATNVVLELVGAANVTRTMRDWGLENTDIFAGLPSGPRAAEMRQPVSTARDLCSLITRIVRRELLGPDSCDEIIRMLRAQRCNDMLPRYIPVGEDWGDAGTWIANKTGYGRCRVEVGVVNADDATFALAMFFEPNAPVPNALKCLADYPPVLAMAHACRAVYECVAE